MTGPGRRVNDDAPVNDGGQVNFGGQSSASS